ncbi:hypothetical protein K438DRAFT_1968026 [Mycena galopus ATCC 62051]|nr:hypothetical protein K438DRAFT_1968026 [Mycena galopus ATCC 62051]
MYPVPNPAPILFSRIRIRKSSHSICQHYATPDSDTIAKHARTDKIASEQSEAKPRRQKNTVLHTRAAAEALAVTKRDMLLIGRGVFVHPPDLSSSPPSHAPQDCANLRALPAPSPEVSLPFPALLCSSLLHLYFVSLADMTPRCPALLASPRRSPGAQVETARPYSILSCIERRRRTPALHDATLRSA